MECRQREQITLGFSRQTSKHNKTQELNCGAWRLSDMPTKPLLFRQGRTEMCLPHVYEKARSMSNVVLKLHLKSF